MSDHPAHLYSLILGCEIAFWVVLALALAWRYVFKRERASRALLLLLPAIDVTLLMFTALDLRAGTQATFAPGLAVAYLGFTLAFGPLAVRVGRLLVRLSVRCCSGTALRLAQSSSGSSLGRYGTFCS